ncbi:type II toxin-antitoxin system VapC family toxin [Roseicella aquatilis]|uniref:Ribonuclease VapC n=1 Tax=Roseicella aquatilis TaxID=2527868 RepID=A0A4V2WL56_9PROT|nr:type II toxin-antitoxin system VapC family toxin [Roseicella aquatilis]TCZ61289.1 PIN domain-containing protein [Roseicella aquatilis]
MTLVLDASAVVALATGEPGAEAFRAMVSGELLIAPELVLSEAGIALWRKHRSGVISAADAESAMADIPVLFDRLLPLSALARPALHLAIAHDHPVHDCFTVALARQEGLPLLTGDRRLAARLGEAAEIRLLA